MKVLNEETNYKKRLISEMIHIKNQNCDLNLQNDTELLDSLYHWSRPTILLIKKFLLFVI